MLPIQKCGFHYLRKNRTFPYLLRNLNKNNKTPLHFAAENDSINMGELLISKGADINAKAGR